MSKSKKETPFFGRRYVLTLSDAKGNEKVFKGGLGEISLDVQFNVSFTLGQRRRDGSVTIYGLSLHTITPYLELSSYSRGDAYTNKLRVKLEAGYLNNPLITIIDGVAYYASLSPPPQLALTLKVDEFSFYGAERKPFAFHAPLKIEDIATAVSRAYGVEFLGYVKGNNEDLLKEPRTFQTTEPKDLIGALEDLDDLADLRFILTKDGVIAYDANLSMCEFKEEVDVNASTGLLSVSGISLSGATVTTFLNDPCPTQLYGINLKSELNPQANGRYNVIKKTFQGHYIGNEWYSTYECVKYQQEQKFK